MQLFKYESIQSWRPVARIITKVPTRGSSSGHTICARLAACTRSSNTMWMYTLCISLLACWLLQAPAVVVGESSTTASGNKLSAMFLDLPLPTGCVAAPDPALLGPISLETELGVLLPLVVGASRTIPPSGGVATVAVVALSNLFGSAWNALAAYVEGAKPVSPTGIPLRPAEQRTLVNKNIAIAFATLRVAEQTVINNREAEPAMLLFVRNAIRAFGTPPGRSSPLDPTDTCTDDFDKPECVGNKAAAVMVALMDSKQVNRVGCQGRAVNCVMYDDYSGYVPKNTVHELKDIYRWQPLRETNRNGHFWAQEQFAPHFSSSALPVTLTAEQFRRRTVSYSRPNSKQYKVQADEVLAESLKLEDDRQKMVAEHIDGGRYAMEGLVRVVTGNSYLYQDLTLALAFFQQVHVRYDATLVAWKNKVKPDSVRPLSAVRYLYGSSKVKAYIASERKVGWVAGNQWVPYLRTAAEGEYPSGALCGCAAWAEWVALWLGSKDSLGSISYEFKKGCSAREPVFTPATNITGWKYNNVDEFMLACQRGRVLGGMHFWEATKASRKLCTGLADITYKWIRERLPSSLLANVPARKYADLD